DGTALYIAVVVSFLFEIYGFELSLAQYAIILFTATLAAVGTAAVPSASLVLMAIVIGAVNNTIPSFAPDKDPLPLHAIGIILGVDRLLDMCRTCVNVWGDSVGAKIITRLAPDD
ncbi:MAG: cation:dicarboxylase symporter family transporter, partial [Planctomycetota bacterium]